MAERQDQQKSEVRPFTAFNFRIELELPDQDGFLCSAEFSECDGLEVSMQPKSYQEGGNNNSQIHLVGPVTNGQLTLKRGMTSSFDMWTWFDQVTTESTYGRRIDGIVVMLSSSLAVSTAFILKRCMPVKLKVPSLNAKDGNIAIEEMQIVYERLERLKN